MSSFIDSILKRAVQLGNVRMVVLVGRIPGKANVLDEVLHGVSSRALENSFGAALREVESDLACS